MAGEVVNGFGSDDSVDYPYEMVYIEIDGFAASAIPWQHMPGFQVLETLTMPEPRRMQRIVEMLEVGIGPEKASDLMLLDLSELEEVVHQWMNKSSDLHRKEDGL